MSVWQTYDAPVTQKLLCECYCFAVVSFGMEMQIEEHHKPIISLPQPSSGTVKHETVDFCNTQDAISHTDTKN